MPPEHQHEHKHHHHNVHKKHHHNHKAYSSNDLADQGAKEGKEEAESEINRNKSITCEWIFSNAKDHCRITVNDGNINLDELKNAGVEKISRHEAAKLHEAGDINATYSGLCGQFASTCMKVCRNSKSEITETSVRQCGDYQEHAQLHYNNAIQMFNYEIQATGTAQAASDSKGGSSGGSNAGASSGSSGNSGGAADFDNGLARRMEARVALGKAIFDGITGNSQQQPSQGWSTASVNNSYGQESQQPSNINQNAEAALRDQNSGYDLVGQEQVQQQVSGSALAGSEVSNTQTLPGYQPSSSGSFGFNRATNGSGSYGSASGGSGKSGSGTFANGAARGISSSGGSGNGEIRVEPMYRMIKVGNVDAASGNGSSEGHGQQPKSINMNDYLPNGSQYQNGYSPSGMDFARQEIQPKATNIWGLISDRTRTLCAQKRLVDCNGN